MGDVSLRELRNDTSRVLRRAEAGEHLRVLVNRRPVAQITPLEQTSPAWVDGEVLLDRIRGSQADAALADELRGLQPDTLADL